MNESFSHPDKAQAPGPIPGIEQLDRYCAGESSAEEAALVYSWISSHHDGESAFEVLRRMRKDVPASWDGKGSWAAIEARLAGEVLPALGAKCEAKWNRQDLRTRGGEEFSEVTIMSEQVKPSPQQRPASRWTARFSAVAALVVLLIVGVWTGRQDAPNTGMVYPSVYATANGERATITLPDSTVVVLNVGSRLEVPPDFTSGGRQVRLHGEALFTVTHQSGLPFTVQTANNLTRVLGTVFAVKNYGADLPLTVAVKEGRVMVDSVVLNAWEEVSFQSGDIHEMRSTYEGRFSFAGGVLTLPEMSLKDAVPELNRWYNADIRLSTAALENHLIEGKFAAGSLSELAENLKWVFNLEVVREGNILTLYPK